MKLRSWALLLLISTCLSAVAQQEQGKTEDSKSAADSQVIPKGARLFIASMPDNFNDFLKDAISKKGVPVTIVENRDQADFEMTGFSETQKASTAKKVIMGSWHSRESASVKVANLKTSTIAFAYSYNNDNSMHGKKTSAEACAKHLKDKIESGK